MDSSTLFWRTQKHNDFSIFPCFRFFNHSLKLYSQIYFNQKKNSQIYLNIHTKSIYLLIILLLLPRRHLCWLLSFSSSFLFLLVLKIFVCRISSSSPPCPPFSDFHSPKRFQWNNVQLRQSQRKCTKYEIRYVWVVGSLLRNWSQHWFWII